MSIRINNKIISGTYTAQSYRYVGEIFQSALPIEDSRVALLDGHKIYESEGYGSFIQYITSLALLYPQLSCTEDEWQLSDTTYGECGKFVINEDGVRLPKIVSFVQGLSSLQDLATLVEAGLPNIIGQFGANFTQGNFFNQGSGAFGSYRVDNINTTVPNDSAIQYSQNNMWDFDASRSSSIYGNSPTVQPQSIRYPYYIVLATGVTQEVKVKEELTTNIPFTLFESKYSEVELNNTSWLLSSGQWNSKELYPSAYNELVKEYNAPTRLHNIVLHNDTYTDYDFVLNLENETFRLPLKIKQRFYEDIAPVAGTGKTLGFTNGTQNFGMTCRYQGSSNFPYTNTALYDVPVGTLGSAGDIDTTNNASIGVTTDASKSGIEAHLTETVNLYLYFYVGDTNINVNLVDTGKLTQEVANLIPNNSGLISGYSMPSDRYVDLELGATGTTYTAPANGWFYAYALATSQYSFLAWERQDTKMQMHIPSANDGYGCGIYIPVRKNDKVNLYYGNKRFEFLMFIYAQGEI